MLNYNYARANARTQKLLAANSGIGSPIARQAIESWMYPTKEQKEPYYCLMFARQIVQKALGWKIDFYSAVKFPPSFAKDAGTMGDYLVQEGFGIAGAPSPGDLVFQRGKPGQMGGRGAIVSRPWGHVGVVVFAPGGDLYVVENTVAYVNGNRNTMRGEGRFKHVRLTPLAEFGSAVAVRIPPDLDRNSWSRPDPGRKTQNLGNATFIRTGSPEIENKALGQSAFDEAVAAYNSDPARNTVAASPLVAPMVTTPTQTFESETRIASGQGYIISGEMGTLKLKDHVFPGAIQSVVVSGELQTLDDLASEAGTDITYLRGFNKQSVEINLTLVEAKGNSLTDQISLIQSIFAQDKTLSLDADQYPWRIVHPATSARGITQVIFKSFSSTIDVSSTNTASVKLVFTEFEGEVFSMLAKLRQQELASTEEIEPDPNERKYDAEGNIIPTAEDIRNYYFLNTQVEALKEGTGSSGNSGGAGGVGGEQ